MHEATHIHLVPLFTRTPHEVVEVYRANQSFLKPYEPLRTSAYFTVDGQRQLLANAARLWEQDEAYTFGICLKESFAIPASDALVGRITLSNVVRGSFQSCTVGYFVSQHVNGRGIATEALRQVVDFAFARVDLHRVQAAVMPRNEKSRRVVEKVGFSFEGLAKHYLQIHGVWEDHHIFSITRESWSAK